ncbi:MAG TPA: hypothetical protein VF331_00795 [Polyangiales bacterium]
MDGILRRRQVLIEYKLPSDDPFFGLDRLHAIVAATARSKRPDWGQALDQWLTPNRETSTQWAIETLAALLKQYDPRKRDAKIRQLCAAAAAPGAEHIDHAYQVALDACWGALKRSVDEGHEPAIGQAAFAARFRGLLVDHTARRVVHDERRSRPSAIARTVVAALITRSTPEAVRKRQKRSPTSLPPLNGFDRKWVVVGTKPSG